MAIRFQCDCGQPLMFAQALVGKPVRCPRCRNELRVPSASVAAVRGDESPPRRAATIWILSVCLVSLALIGVMPAFYDLQAHLRTNDAPGLSTWAYLVVFVSGVQISYAIYLWQLPDWSSLWVVTIVTLFISVGYAMVLGATYVSPADGWAVELIQLSDKLPGGQATSWSFLMLCLTSLFSYVSGRVSVRWHQRRHYSGR